MRSSASACPSACTWIRSTGPDRTGFGGPSPYPGGMAHPDDREIDPDDLLSTLEVIEAQPLATRADAYDTLHDTLARRLEAAPGSAPAS